MTLENSTALIDRLAAEREEKHKAILAKLATRQDSENPITLLRPRNHRIKRARILEAVAKIILQFHDETDVDAINLTRRQRKQSLDRLEAAARKTAGLLNSLSPADRILDRQKAFTGSGWIPFHVSAIADKVGNDDSR